MGTTSSTQRTSCSICQDELHHTPCAVHPDPAKDCLSFGHWRGLRCCSHAEGRLFLREASTWSSSSREVERSLLVVQEQVLQARRRSAAPLAHLIAFFTLIGYAQNYYFHLRH